jgi:hypothetical protein
MSRWSCPEYQTVSGICKSRLNSWILEPFEIRINNQARKVCGEELGFLLAVASCAMSGITGLNSGLRILAVLLIKDTMS